MAFLIELNDETICDLLALMPANRHKQEECGTLNDWAMCMCVRECLK